MAVSQTLIDRYTELIRQRAKIVAQSNFDRAALDENSAALAELWWDAARTATDPMSVNAFMEKSQETCEKTWMRLVGMGGWSASENWPNMNDL